MKSLRELVVKKDVVDLKGMTIRKGTKIYVMKEGPEHPTEKYRVLVVRVDNGTDDLSLCPETAIRDNQL